MKKIKLSKTSLLILCVGVFVVVVASLGVARSQQLQEQGRLEEELNMVEMRLSQLEVTQLIKQQEELQWELDENIMQLTAAKDKLHQLIESIDVTDKFFEIAQSCNVTVMNISSSGIGSENLGDIACSAITLNAVVTGEVPNLISFVISLNDDFTTGIVKSAQITVPPG